MSAKLWSKTAGVLGTALLLLSVACQITQQTNRQTTVAGDTKSWDSYVNEFLESYFVAHPDFAVRAGRHELDGKLPNWSDAGIATEILNYTMGKLMIKKLREDWTATRGGRQAWQSFHDEFLKYGGPPIPLVRKAMLGGDRGSLF
jgi:hypothetical protein